LGRQSAIKRILFESFVISTEASELGSFTETTKKNRVWLDDKTKISMVIL
jgi:hypothetical protein